MGSWVPARAQASFNLEPLTRARADPGPLSLRGPLSKEIVFSSGRTVSWPVALQSQSDISNMFFFFMSKTLSLPKHFRIQSQSDISNMIWLMSKKVSLPKHFRIQSQINIAKQSAARHLIFSFQSKCKILKIGWGYSINILSVSFKLTNVAS